MLTVVIQSYSRDNAKVDYGCSPTTYNNRGSYEYMLLVKGSKSSDCQGRMKLECVRGLIC